MAIRPFSLQGRFTLYLILPVLTLLVIMGLIGFLLARDLLLTQWQESAILRLGRAAHQMDMHLAAVKQGIRLFHDISGSIHDDSFHAWALDRLRRQEGIVDARLSWNSPQTKPDPAQEPAPPARGLGHGFRAGGMRRFQSARIREITAPRFDAGGAHGTISMVSELLDEAGAAIGRLEVVVDFDLMFGHVVESGWWQSSKAFLVDENGQVLVCTAPGRHGKISDAGDPLEKATFAAMAHQTHGTVWGKGYPPSEISGFYRLTEAPWFLVMIAPGREVLSPILQFRWAYSIAAIGLILLVTALIRLVTGRVASEIKTVSEAALRLSRGKFDDPLPVKRRDEVGELTRSFNLMTRHLRERLQLKQAMGLAMEVQQNLLPAAPACLPGFDIAGRSLYCQETGGDYFDYIFRNGEEGRRHLCIAVGDVVGHGISAALLMTTVRALLRIRLDCPGPIPEALTDVNRLLCRDTEASGSFVTLFLLQVQADTRRLAWVRAGHDPALLFSAANGDVQELNGPGLALGVNEAFAYTGVSPLGLHTGDIVLIGTDGIWDTRNSRSEKFGKTRLVDIMRRHRQDPAEAILEAVLRSVEQFRGQMPQEDDITLVVLKAAGPAAGTPG
ncbi:MAG: SpoIIE family protein phosphatase [Desulfobacterales bacterium]|nr:SpoIIE family protein phosphatase [Desulfobacterales bacterium]